MAGYLLRLVNCLENVDESHLDENSKGIFSFGKEWLFKVFVVLYRGGLKGKYEMEINDHYPAARECIMVLDKLADMGNGFAQKEMDLQGWILMTMSRLLKRTAEDVT